MNKRLRLLPITLLLILGVVLTGCSTKNAGKKASKSNDTAELTECLNKCKKANSVEASINSTDLTMDMKMQDIHGDMKAYINMDLEGQKQEFFLERANDQYKIYVQSEGQYYSKVVDSSELSDINTDDSFDAYIEIVKDYPSMFKKEGKDTYVMNPSKSKMQIYIKL